MKTARELSGTASRLASQMGTVLDDDRKGLEQYRKTTLGNAVATTKAILVLLEDALDVQRKADAQALADKSYEEYHGSLAILTGELAVLEDRNGGALLRRALGDANRWRHGYAWDRVCFRSPDTDSNADSQRRAGWEGIKDTGGDISRILAEQARPICDENRYRYPADLEHNRRIARARKAINTATSLAYYILIAGD